MKQVIKYLFSAVAMIFLSMVTWAAPTVFPTGTTIYDPDKTWNGYTVFSILATPAAVVIDMNGQVVKQWDGFNVSAGGPARILPGGIVISTSGANPPHQESLEIIQQDFDGNEMWSFRSKEQIENQEGELIWSARQHHDWQREDFPAGYYSPEFEPAALGSNTLLLTHTNRMQTDVADVTLEDDTLIEVSSEGEIVWQWRIGDHIDEFEFDAEERAAIKSATGFSGFRGSYDWMHINSATYLGPNRWFDAGDERFAPNNIIISSRQSSVIAIIGRDGSVVWQIGPDFSRTEEEQAIGQIIGQHHAHFIPKGLPGAGNLMIFDNGGSSGYGDPSPISPSGQGIYARSNSRIVEINPVTLELVWSYTSANFFSTNISGAQRLENGNTLITEGAPGRVFEITSAGEIVWEYMNAPSLSGSGSNSVYRAYRLPYSWIPQLDEPSERAVNAPAPGSFILP
jgi:hypothetical protein